MANRFRTDRKIDYCADIARILEYASQHIDSIPKQFITQVDTIIPSSCKWSEFDSNINKLMRQRKGVLINMFNRLVDTCLTHRVYFDQQARGVYSTNTLYETMNYENNKT